ncbi:MAG: hypothetical protein ACLRSE_07940 [Alistipes finegoldii]
MKKIITRLFILGALIALIALLPAGAAAQQLDARQRNAETVVADGLAQASGRHARRFQRSDGRTCRYGKRRCRNDRRHAHSRRQG